MTERNDVHLQQQFTVRSQREKKKRGESVEK